MVSLDQLREVGISKRTASRWVAAGRLGRVHRGVYSLGAQRISDRGRLTAAVLACGADGAGTQSGRALSATDAVLSHRSAAFLLGMFEPLPSVVDVISGRQAGRWIDGIRTHSVTFPESNERGWVDGIPCTSPAWTLVDLAGVLGERSLRDAVERAATRRLLDIPAVDVVLSRGRRRGAKRLRAILAEWRPVETLVRESNLRSPFEARLLPLLGAGVPLPEVNARVRVARRTLEVDLLWRDHRLVVEADSRRHHGIDLAFERDRTRDRELIDAGYTVIRVTWRQAEREPTEIAASIRAFLER